MVNKCSIMKTKDLILQETFGLLLTRGYNGVSVSDIQQTTGMARGLLYHYFGNQDELIHVCIQTFFERWYLWNKTELKDLAVTGLITYLVERYNRVSREMSEYWGEVNFVNAQMLFGEAAYHDKLFSEIYRLADVHLLGAWKIAVLNSFSRGELRTGLNLESVARHFIYIQEGVLFNNAVDATGTDIPYVLQKSLEDFLEIIRR